MIHRLTAISIEYFDIELRGAQIKQIDKPGSVFNRSNNTMHSSYQ